MNRREALAAMGATILGSSLPHSQTASSFHMSGSLTRVKYFAAHELFTLGEAFQKSQKRQLELHGPGWRLSSIELVKHRFIGDAQPKQAWMTTFLPPHKEQS